MASLKQLRRLASGSSGLDAMLGGGFPEGCSVLVSGAPGVGKTTLGLQFLVAGALQGEAGLLVTFEQFPASLVRDALNLGWDLRAMEAAGQLHLVFTSPEVFAHSLQAPDSPLSETLRALAPQRAVIDSMAHLYRLAGNPVELRGLFNTVVNGLKREGITSLLLDEATRLFGPQSRHIGALPFLVDAIIMMRYVEVDSAMQRAIAVLKLRGSAHAREIRSFTIQRGGIQVGEPFSQREGILSGIPRQVGW